MSLQTAAACAASSISTTSPQTVATPAPTPLALATSAPTPSIVLPTPTPTPEPTAIPPSPKVRMYLHANSVSYDSDRFTLVARDNVSLRMENGFFATARYFTMDVRSNRYILAGHVHVTGPNVALDGAAIANFLDFGRVYLLTSATTPDRVTFLDETFAHPTPGREMPSDAFHLPENLNRHASIQARGVLIIPHITLRFGIAQLNTGIITVPIPDYVLNLSSNPNFAQNSLAGASFDASYPFAGSPNASTAFHIRAGGGNGIFGAVEQRFAWKKSYIVGSVSPLNHSLKQYNVLGSTSLTPTLQVQGFAQEQAFQHGFSQPLNASLYINIRATQALKRSYLQLTLDQYYQSLLADPNGNGPNGCGECYGDAAHQFIPNHPINAQISWIGFDHKIPKLPLKFRLRSGYNYNHDFYGILPNSALNPGTISYTQIQPQFGGLIGVGVQNITSSFVGGTLYTPSYRVFRDRKGNDVFFNASFDAQRKWYSLPHQVNTTTSAFSVSKTYGTKLSTFISYTIAHTGDQYGDQQRNVYPLPTPGSSVYGSADFAAFDGFATLHTLSQGIVYTPTANFNTSLTVAETKDFPATVSGVFGPPPISVTGEVRAHLRPHLWIDLTRTYYYNYGAQHFNPGYGLLIGG